MEYRNPVYTAGGLIDCEINHPTHGWVPFTCDPNDASAPFDTAALFAAMQATADPYTPPPPPSDEQAGDDVRAERNRRLTATDWTQVADAPVDKAAWAVYRQALRDIPQQDGFPHDIAWPVKP